MKRVYTNEIFIDYQHQVVLSMNHVVNHNDRPLGEVMQVVEVYETSNFNLSATVRANSLTGRYECSCRLMSSYGIPCCHIICVKMARRISRIPDELILDRWRCSGRGRFTPPSIRRPTNNVMNMRNVCNEIFEFVRDQEEATQFVDVALKETLQRVN